jgi:enoyl-CoA hydratase
MKTRYKTFNLEITESLAIITIPDLSSGYLQRTDFSYEFSDICADIEADSNIRVVVVALSGEKSGGKENASEEFSSSTDREILPALPGFCESIAGLDRPIIAAIQGDATGLGLELAMACDIRIASGASRFGLPHIKSGLIPSDGGTQRLPRLVGKGKALEMVLTGELIDAQEALRIGLVNVITPSGDVINRSLKLASEMTTKAPVSLRFAREAIYKGMDMTLDQGLRMEGDLYLLLYTTSDRVEGITSFIKKKTPVFQGK